MAKPYKIEHYKEGSALPKRVEKCRVRRNSAEYREFREHLIQRGNKQLSLREICTLMGIDVPYKFRHIADEKNQNLSVSEAGLRVGGIMFLVFEDIDMKQWLDNMVKIGAKVIFVDRKAYFRRARLWFRNYPVIFLDDIIEQVGAVFSTIKAMNQVKTIAMTGSVGKTTTNKLCNSIIAKEYNVVTNKGNLNSYKSIANHIFSDLTSETEVYIQEVGAANINSVRKAGCMLRPDAFILLNVEKHHMNHYKTFENLFDDKTSMDDYLAEDGVVIANFDDEGIASHQFKHRVISFGIDTEKDVDYRAANIVQNRDVLELDVLHDGKTTHMKLHVFGKYNAYNALAAFAVSRWMKIPETKIVEHIASYHAAGIRQSFQNIGGRYLYVDCYNACEASIIATANAFNEFELDEENRKIGYITGENALGDYARETSLRIGRGLGESKLDEIVCVGTDKTDEASINDFGDVAALLEGIRQTGEMESQILTDVDAIAEHIRKNVNVGDLAIFKGLDTLDMTVALDKALGTGFSYDYRYYTLRTVDIEEGDYKGRVIEVMGESELLGVDNLGAKLVIPDEFAGYPVFRIGKRIFKDKWQIREIDFGSSVKNIGKGAFYNCSGLETLRIPGNVKVIERGAFRSCENLKSVVMEDGVTHIGQNAFRANSKLEKVFIPKTVLNIETDAFKYSNGVTIICEKGSYAETYAVANSIEYKNI